MAKRPEGMDLEEWRAQRAAHWRRVNRLLNVGMVIAAGLLAWRYFTD